MGCYRMWAATGFCEYDCREPGIEPRASREWARLTLSRTRCRSRSIAERIGSTANFRGRLDLFRCLPGGGWHNEIVGNQIRSGFAT